MGICGNHGHVLDSEEHKIETNFISFKKSEYNDDILIDCDPSPNHMYTGSQFILKSGNSKFNELHNELNIDKSYRLTYINHSIEHIGHSKTIIYYEITDIEPCIIHQLTILIKDLIDTNDVNLHNYKQIVTSRDRNRDIKLLIDNDNVSNIIIDRGYTVKFKKFYKSNIYLITEIAKLI